MVADIGWNDLTPRWQSLTLGDRKQMTYSSIRSDYILGGGATDGGRPQPEWTPCAPPPPRHVLVSLPVDPPVDVKQSHLHGNAGVISNPRPNITDNVKNYLVPFHVSGAEQARPSPSSTFAPKERKMFEQSSELFESPRLLNTSTLTPQRELHSANYVTFPYEDSTLDTHAEKRPQVLDPECESPPSSPAARRPPPARFEPPSRPGACFRRRKEKNYSDLFDVNPPPAAGACESQRVPRVDANQLWASFSFQDIRTEVARRNGELRRMPQRMLSEPDLAGALKRSVPAGMGGSGGGGEDEVRVALAEEGAVLAASEAPSAVLWASSPESRKDMWSSPESRKDTKRVAGKGLTELLTADVARRQYSNHMNSSVFTPKALDAEEAPSPRALSTPRTQLGNSKPVLGVSSPRSGSLSPRSPRVVCCGDDRGGTSDDKMHILPCKAAARERFRRHMSSNVMDLFGVQCS